MFAICLLHILDIDPLPQKVTILASLRVRWVVVILIIFETRWVVIILIIFESKCCCLMGQGTLTLEGYTPFCKVNFFNVVLCLYWVHNGSLHDHWIMFFLHVQLNIHSGSKMNDHYIPYIFFNERIVCKNMAFVFVETIVIGCRFGFSICTLIKFIPYLFSK